MSHAVALAIAKSRNAMHMSSYAILVDRMASVMRQHDPEYPGYEAFQALCYGPAYRDQP